MSSHSFSDFVVPLDLSMVHTQRSINVLYLIGSVITLHSIAVFFGWTISVFALKVDLDY